MKLVQFENGSYTLEDFNQTMHSRVGPEVEAKTVYFDQSGILGLISSQDRIVLYDIGLGIAANPCVTLNEILKTPLEKPLYLEIHSFENQLHGLKMTLDFLKSPEGQSQWHFLFPWKDSLAQLLETGHYKTRHQNLTLNWQVHWGDFLTTFDPKRLPKANVTYYDFYSPQHHPELWGVETLALLKTKTSRLVTYATATAFRVALLLNDFWVCHGSATSAKKETTIAGTGLVPNELKPLLLKASWLDHLRRSTLPLPKDYFGSLSKLLQTLESLPQFF